jgi:hypothetical protein
MEKPHRNSSQIYGYTVCLVAVITFLIAAAQIVNAAMDLSDPLHGRWAMLNTVSLASFENYKMDVLKSPQRPGGEVKVSSYIPDDETMRAMYEAAKAEKIQSVKHQSYRSMLTNGLLILISIILFLTHWRLARRSIKLEMV